jgi:hypothetical protein
MIINDAHKVVFIHIPKCGGVTIRTLLGPYDDAEGSFKGVRVHEELGEIDCGHIPLFVLQEHFPKEYQKIKDYETYAVVRHPLSRFPSSVSQYVKWYGEASIRYLTLSEIHAHVDNVIDILQSHEHDQSYLPYQYIHFQRQIDFIYNNKRKLIDNVNTIENISDVILSIGKKIGKEFDDAAEGGYSKNETLVFRNKLIRCVYGIAKSKIWPLVPTSIQKSTAGFLRDAVYVSRQSKLGHTFESNYIQDFIRSYYAKDIKMYEELAESG